jgi:hypothetical protein
MATETIIQYTDDIDGSEATETISFAFRGIQYEIDLGEKNSAAFDKALSKFVNNARPAGVESEPRPKARRSSGTRQPKKSAVKAAATAGSVREWAQANGYAVGNRGRIPAAAREAYEAAVG